MSHNLTGARLVILLLFKELVCIFVLSRVLVFEISLAVLVP